MNAFWTDVASGLISTVVGVGLGVPVGLWLNRRALRASEQSADVDRRARVAELLGVASDAVEHNAQMLRGHLQHLSNNRIAISPAFHTATWEAISADVIRDVRQPALRHALSFHFAAVSQWKELNDRYVDYAVGMLATTSMADRMKETLKSILVTRATESVEQADALLADIRRTIDAAKD